MGNLKNKFSIILPLKNGGEYARSCVNSILAQTCRDFSLIILDNCSSDDNLNWLRNLNDNRIIIHTSARPLKIEENWSRIKSVDKNEFMTMIGHDDILHPHYLKTMEMLIDKHPRASLFQTHFNYINEKGELLRACKPMEEIMTVAGFISAHCLQSLDSSGSGYMIRSVDYNSLGGIPTDYPGFIFADYELWINLISKGYLAISKDNCFSYRLNQSASQTMGAEKYQKSFFHYLDFLKEIMEKDMDCKKAVERDGIHLFNYYCRSLSHRLLKSSYRDRKTKIWQFVNKCKEYAEFMIPNHPFHPYLNPSIMAAVFLDNKPGKWLFKKARKYLGSPYQNR